MILCRKIHCTSIRAIDVHARSRGKSIIEVSERLAVRQGDARTIS